MSVYPPNQIPQTRNSTMAIVSLISGIAGWSLLPYRPG
jgi:hypothetical protein